MIMSSKDTKKPLAIVTGGFGYVGKIIVKQLELSGWRVAVLSRKKGTETSAPLYRCDVTSEKSVREAVAKIVSDLGGIQACVHAAVAPMENKPLTDISAVSFDTALSTAARGAFLLAKAAVPHMERGAAFIGITTTLIEPAAKLMPMGGYIPAKYALRGFLRAFASEQKARGIRVYAVSPGFIAGGLNRDVPKAVLSLLAKKSEAGETTAENVAEVIVKICTEPAAYPSSSSISVPGEVTPL